MTIKIKTEPDDSEEVWEAQFITSVDERTPKTVRYNDVAYQRKLDKQHQDENPITQRGPASQ